MKTRDFFKELVCNPEEVNIHLDAFEYIYEHVNFSSQIDIKDRNYWNQHVLYEQLLMFLSHIPNYVGLNQSINICKGKLAYFLPKKAFKERINKIFKSYSNKDIFDKLTILGQNKVVGQADLVVDLFEITKIPDMEESEDYWILWFHQSIIPYLCGLATLVILNVEGIIPFIPGELLSLEDMVEERKKAGLNIPHMMEVLSSKEIKEFRESV
jgi:hypothetical protein